MKHIPGNLFSKTAKGEAAQDSDPGHVGAKSRRWMKLKTRTAHHFRTLSISSKHTMYIDVHYRGEGVWQ
jgi:hypothetical protein